MVYGPATIDNLRDSIFSIFSARGNEGNRLSYESVVFLLRISEKNVEKKRVRGALEDMVKDGILQKNEGSYTLRQEWYLRSLRTSGERKFGS